MSSPRIVIADTDTEGKLATNLQIKFIEKMFQQINLEIIDDEEYCNDFFVVQQKIEVLIISEHLYQHLQKWHDIGHLFVITDQNGQTGVDGNKAVWLYRFDPIDHLFHSVLENCPGLTPVSGTQNSQIIVFSSASGGAGKTTVALGVSFYLASAANRVLYIDAERLHTFPSLITNREPEKASDFYKHLTKQNEFFYQNIKRYFRHQRFDYLPPFDFAVMSHGIPFSTFEKIAVAARESGDYDYIIVDTDSVYDEYKASLFGTADKVMILSKQTPDALEAAAILAQNINGLEKEKYKFVCNDCDFSDEDEISTHNSRIRWQPVERIGHITEIQKKTLEEIVKETGIQKAANLIA